MGSAAAYFLMRLGGAGLRVLVCETDPTFASSATVKAAGGIRQTFALEENIRMSCFGARFMRDAAAELAIDGQQPDLSFHPNSYLYLGAGEAKLVQLRACHDLRAALGVPGLWLDRPSLEGRFPWLAVDDVDGGLLGGPEEGVIDPEPLLRALWRKASALGAVFETAQVVGFGAHAGRIESVLLASGERIACRFVINAAGAHAANLAALVGANAPIVPRKATTFIFRTSAALPDDLPIVVDRVQGLHFKREGDVFLASLPAHASEGGTVDYELFETEFWPALAHRVPAFEAIKFAGAWVGTIDASPVDGNPFIGPHPDLPNFLFLAGFNGHGLQHAPAAGRAIAELVVHGKYDAIDLSRFGFERLGTPASVVEPF